MNENPRTNDIDFTVDRNNLYREVMFTDLKVASIKKLVPIHPDGSEDKNRSVMFVGETQLMTPSGPLPIHAHLEADSLEKAMDLFPQAMERSFREMVATLQRIQQEQEKEERAGSSRLIVPGR
jgi:hypothetical protein